MTIERRVNDGKPLTMDAVGERAKLMLDLMALEIGDLADFQDAVLRHRGIPHKFAASLIIIRPRKHHADIANDVAHNRLIDVVGHVIGTRGAEVGFHAVTERVESAGNDLAEWHGQGV